jgi:hypothetical protein
MADYNQATCSVDSMRNVQISLSIDLLDGCSILKER